MSEHAPKTARNPSFKEFAKSVGEKGLAVMAVGVAAATLAGKNNPNSTPSKHGKAAAMDISAAPAIANRFGRLAPEAALKPSDSKHEAAKGRLRRFNQLPGWGQKVSETQRQALQNATTKLAIRPKGVPEPSGWSNFYSCTAFAVNANGQTYMASAAHCLVSLTNNKWGLLSGPKDSAEYWNLQAGGQDYAFEGPSFWVTAPSGDYADTPQPMALASGLAIKYGQDAALFSVDTSTISSDFNSLQPLDTKNLAIKPPPAGVEVAMYAMPGSNEGIPVIGTGIYLGRLKSDNRLVDVVVTKATSPQTDDCYYGASGSTAVFANGQFTFALSRRSNIGYPPNFKMDPVDMNNYDYGSALTFRYNMSQALNVSIPAEYDTLCEFQAPDVNLINSMSKSLTATNNPQPYPDPEP